MPKRAVIDIGPVRGKGGNHTRADCDQEEVEHSLPVF